MKKAAAIAVAVLGMCAWSFGQSNDKPRHRLHRRHGGRLRPRRHRRGNVRPGAKTQPEFEAYKAAMAQTDPAALEKAADDFAAKFPDSELRSVLVYGGDEQRYQQANNADKMMDMAQKVLDL